MVYNNAIKDVAGDTFTQLLGINNAETIVSYHGATADPATTCSSRAQASTP